MISEKYIKQLTALLAVLFWLAWLGSGLLVHFGMRNQTSFILEEAQHITLGLYMLALVIHYRYRVTEVESANFIDLLWRVFVSGLIAVVVSLAIGAFQGATEGRALGSNILVIRFLFTIEFGVIVLFVVTTFTVWKRLILYRKTKTLLRLWRVFEYLLLGSLLLGMFNDSVLPGSGSTISNLSFGITGLAIIAGLVLSINQRWVAYLNLRQKWNSILLIILVGLYLFYFVTRGVDYMEWEGLDLALFSDVLTNTFIRAVSSFIIVYALLSLLVILFNLPTSSAFEQKLEEVINFQRLSQSISSGKREDQVYHILLESAISAVSADAAWLELKEEHQDPLYITHEIELDEIEEVRQCTSKAAVLSILNMELTDQAPLTRQEDSLKGSRFRSIVVFPLIVQNKQIGSLSLLKELSNGFNKEMTEIIVTFVSQASISIENFRLLNEAIENERYKEELKIAQRVQHTLLPAQLSQDNDYVIETFSEAADEVGGDFYDSFRLNSHRVAMIIGDVSGKGTSAAFNMSQMKGVFHTLVEMDPSPGRFMSLANNALSRCLEKTSFITATFFVIDTAQKEVCFSRAGHCPALYYNASLERTSYLQSKGLGLGILRNCDYTKHNEVQRFSYQPNDVFMLFTDGITEASNAMGQEYGYDRLKDFLQQNAHLSPAEIKEGLLEELYTFSGQKRLDDDYSAVVIKFN